MRLAIGGAVLAVGLLALASGAWATPGGGSPWFVAGLNFGLLAAFVGCDVMLGRSR
jgi:hypothetical protein